jgi:hypothetical protein
MLQCPVRSPYPRKKVCLAIVALRGATLWRLARSTMRILEEQHKNTVLGIAFKQDAKKNSEVDHAISLGCLLLVRDGANFGLHFLVELKTAGGENSS